MPVRELESVLIEGQPTRVFELWTTQGMTVQLMEYGAVLLAVNLPDKTGRVANVVLGLNKLTDYADNPAYFGGVCGRVANRISNAAFSLDGTRYQLEANLPPHHLHGGSARFDQQRWQVSTEPDRYGNSVKLCYTSLDGEAGYPGELDLSVTYALTPDHKLTLTYEAEVSGRATVVNLTNHTYWNLAGTGDVLNHQLTLSADHMLEVDEDLIPSGRFTDVINTPFDFNSPMLLGERLSQLSSAYDHCYVISDNLVAGQRSARKVAQLSEPASGRIMTVTTDQPGVQLYLGNALDGSEAVGGHPQYGGVCLECQQLPDAPNRPEFPSIRIDPGQTYRQQTTYQF